MYLSAVTGTDGKTSVASFTRQMWGDAGFRTASLGTLGIVSPMGRRPTPLIDARMSAFPDLIDLLKKTDRLSHIVFEALSASLEDQLYDAVDVTAAAFTTISPEHLDIHGSYRDYQIAKSRLFTHVLSGKGTAVINTETEFGCDLESICQRRGINVICYGKNGDLKLCEANPHPDGTSARIAGLGPEFRVVLPVVGRFMVMNALAAAGLALSTGVSSQSIQETLSHLKAPPGRMQYVTTLRGASVYVDFAHTPGALRSALLALRMRCKHKLIVIFGCGGNRDSSKRPVMGQVAGQIADHVIVTDDNPRSESAAAIRSSIMTELPDADEIYPRQDAISYAMDALKSGDVLLVAGRGEEKEQHVDGKSIPGSDTNRIFSHSSSQTRVKNSENGSVGSGYGSKRTPLFHICFDQNIHTKSSIKNEIIT